MPYLGKTQLGKHLYLSVLTDDGSGAPAAPDDAPEITVFNQSFSVVLSAKKIPAVEKNRYTGVFHYRLFVGHNPHVPLNAAFAAGRYFVRYDWTESGTNYSVLDTFDVDAGGNNSGAVVAMESFDRPHGRHLVMQLDNGNLIAGRNPQV